MENTLQKKVSFSLKEKGQYVLAFGVIASMLIVTKFPVLVVFFFAVFAYLLMKMFAAAGRSETRDIFEFYLSSNEILRDDDRRWFGFEIKEAIFRGESIAHRLNPPPPLVLFTLGALYNRIGDHNNASNYLARALEGEAADETKFVDPSPELRNYVRVLRKIEREPGDAPLTSGALRGLERARKMRGKVLLAESRSKLENTVSDVRDEIPALVPGPVESMKNRSESNALPDGENEVDHYGRSTAIGRERTGERRRTQEEKYSNRKPISEVLHDIYDKNVR